MTSRIRILASVGTLAFAIVFPLADPASIRV